MNNYLFVCQENRLRSPTCEHVARTLGFTADSAGTSLTAVRPLHFEAVLRAEAVVCMEPFHQRYLRSYMRSVGFDQPKSTFVWDIPDKYDYCQPELIAIVREKLLGVKL